MELIELVKLSLMLHLLGLLWQFLTLAIIGGLIYKFRERIKNYFKNILKEAVVEMLNGKN